MAEPYLERLLRIVDRVGTVSTENVTLQTKHFFGGAALYAKGNICVSLSRAGLAVKLPPESRQRLIDEGEGSEFRFFASGPIKREYVALSDSVVGDAEILRKIVHDAVGYAVDAAGLRSVSQE